MRFRLFITACLAVTIVSTPLFAEEDGIFHPRRPFAWTEPNYPSATTPPGTIVVPPQPKTLPNDLAAPSTPQTAPAADPTPQIAPMVSAALGDTSFAVAAPGYIDFAKPMNQIRLRYDSASNMNRPDRAEFIYGKCGCFGGNAPGPILPERTVDTQEPALYVEIAPTERFSVFIDVPFRAINPDVNANNFGLSDIRYGFKYAFIYTDEQIMTFQLRGYAPTGNAREGLGTNHNTLEPSILYTRMLSDKLTLYGEFGDWIPLDGTDFKANVLIYGLGLGYTAYECNGFRVTPLVETIGWTVLGGRELDPNLGTSVSAAGNTIVNGKIGVRAGDQRQDFYVGYGRALTGDQWYQDILRFEYRFKF